MTRSRRVSVVVVLDEGDAAELGQPLVGVGLTGLVSLGGVLEPGDRLVLAAGREQGLGVGVEEPSRPGLGAGRASAPAPCSSSTAASGWPMSRRAPEATMSISARPAASSFATSALPASSKAFAGRPRPRSQSAIIGKRALVARHPAGRAQLGQRLGVPAGDGRPRCRPPPGPRPPGRPGPGPRSRAGRPARGPRRAAGLPSPGAVRRRSAFSVASELSSARTARSSSDPVTSSGSAGSSRRAVAGREPLLLTVPRPAATAAAAAVPAGPTLAAVAGAGTGRAPAGRSVGSVTGAAVVGH